MSKIIQNEIYTIYWKPWKWKTFFAAYLASIHKRIYANFEIMFKGKQVANIIWNIDDIEKIDYSDMKGVVVLDEGGINLNARRSMSDANMEFWKLGMLWRKKNVNIIVISQLERMTDIYFRELSGCSFTMNSWFESHDKLMFEFELSRNGKVVWSKFVDLFEWSQKTGYTYDTLESGKIDLISRKEKPRYDFSLV